MVVHDLNIFCARFLPTKADAPFIVDTNAMGFDLEFLIFYDYYLKSNHHMAKK